MKRVSHSIKRINKILCSVLMLVTPERSVIKRAQKIASPLFSPTPPDTMKLEMRSIEGIHMRYAEAGDQKYLRRRKCEAIELIFNRLSFDLII